jgi:hypothetical protein
MRPPERPWVPSGPWTYKEDLTNKMGIFKENYPEDKLTTNVSNLGMHLVSL